MKISFKKIFILTLICLLCGGCAKALTAQEKKELNKPMLFKCDSYDTTADSICAQILQAKIQYEILQQLIIINKNQRKP